MHSGSPTVELVSAAFGLTPEPGASIAAMSRGAVGRIWRLDLGADRYAVKELFSESDEESIRREIAFTAHLQSAGIRLPDSVPGTDGRYLVPLNGGTGDSWLRLYRWIDGGPADLTDPGLATRLGTIVARLHTLALPAQGPPDPWYETVPAPDTWHQLADTACAQGASWARALASRVSLLATLTDLVTPAARDQLVICHCDLHPDNVLVDSTGELVLLDWDDAGPACPDRDLAAVLAFWYINERGHADEAAVERTLRAYRSVGGPGRLRNERSFGMYIAGRMNFLHGQACVALDPGPGGDDRQHASSEVSDALARLPTISMISRLLSLAAATLG